MKPKMQVTRLFRHDHSDPSVMLESEARWQQLSGQSLVQLSSSAATYENFTRLSSNQIKWLGDHHRSAPVSVLAGDDKDAGDYSVTRMTGMSSEYVGPVGVGTVCAQRAPTSSLVASKTLNSASSQACRAQEEVQVWTVFDTGSTNIWIPSDICEDSACRKNDRALYDHQLSQTYAKPEVSGDLKVTFGTGSLSGPQAFDDFHIGPFTVRNQSFQMIKKMEGAVFTDNFFEGILGLAFPQMALEGTVPFFDNVIEQKALKQNTFAFYFSLNNPSANAVFWGGWDHSFHDGPVEYFNVTTPFYWSISLLSLKIGGEELLPTMPSGNSLLSKEQESPVVKPTTALVDTGTTLFAADGALYSRIMSKLQITMCDAMTDETHPPVVIRLHASSGEEVDYVLENWQYMTSDGLECFPGFMRVGLPEGGSLVLGEIFLRHFFSVFDRADGDTSRARVGLAPSSHGPELEVRLKSLTHGQPSLAERNKVLAQQRKDSPQPESWWRRFLSWFGM